MNKNAIIQKRIKTVLIFAFIAAAAYFVLLRITGVPVIYPPMHLNNTKNAVVVVDVHTPCYHADITDTYLYALYDNRILYTYRGLCKGESHESISDENYMQSIFKTRKQLISKKSYNDIIACCQKIENLSDKAYMYKKYASSDTKCVVVKYNGHVLAEPDCTDGIYGADLNTNQLENMLMNISINYPCNYDTFNFVWKRNEDNKFKLVSKNTLYNTAQE